MRGNWALDSAVCKYGTVPERANPLSRGGGGGAKDPLSPEGPSHRWGERGRGRPRCSSSRSPSGLPPLSVPPHLASLTARPLLTPPHPSVPLLEAPPGAQADRPLPPGPWPGPSSGTTWKGPGGAHLRGPVQQEQPPSSGWARPPPRLCSHLPPGPLFKPRAGPCTHPLTPWLTEPGLPSATLQLQRDFHTWRRTPDQPGRGPGGSGVREARTVPSLSPKDLGAPPHSG